MDVPNNFPKYLSFNMFLSTNTKLSNTSYKLLSTDENRFSNILFIVFIICLIFHFSLPFYINDCIADSTKSIAKINI